MYIENNRSNNLNFRKFRIQRQTLHTITFNKFKIILDLHGIMDDGCLTTLCRSKFLTRFLKELDINAGKKIN